MNRVEKNILHRIYFLSELVDSELLFEPEELYWVGFAKKCDKRTWRGESGNLKRLSSNKGDWLQSKADTENSVNKALSYLRSIDCLTYTKTDTLYRVKITGKGAGIARKLDSYLGRLDLVYRDNKDGVIWFLATVVVSAVTSFLIRLFE